jgi:hypothetical protein
MVPAFAILLLAATPPEPAPAQPASLRAEGAPQLQTSALAGADDVASLCRRLVPAERLRLKGDALEQGEARTRQEALRDEAITGRYEITVPAAKLAFAPYDGPEQRLEVAEPATLRLGTSASIVAMDARGLPVQVNAAIARRILAAQAAGRLSLRLVFDLPDDAICASSRRGKAVSLGVEPVEWMWLDGGAPLAWGGVAGDRASVSVAVGGQPTVDVGEPIAGPSEAKKAVLARRAELAACYAEGLRRAPALDGVLVVDLGPRVAVSADSTGSDELARCVEKALAALAGTEAASVPIRFELALPRDGGVSSAVEAPSATEEPGPAAKPAGVGAAAP